MNILTTENPGASRFFYFPKARLCSKLIDNFNGKKKDKNNQPWAVKNNNICIIGILWKD